MNAETTRSVDLAASCCSGVSTGALEMVGDRKSETFGTTSFDLDMLTVHEANGISSLTLLVDNLHCAGCIATVERQLGRLPGVIEVRVNFSTQRARIRWHDDEIRPDTFLTVLEEIGYPARPFDVTVSDRAGAREERELLRCLAVAGFAAANVMLLSVSVWSGAAADMSVATRDLFHWVSALVALPAVAYAGRPFFKSALVALSSRRLNMDVPISLAVILAAGMSLVETIRSGQHAYFDASVTLLFFLLVGRYLDRRMRARARNAAERLLSLSSASALVVDPDGQSRRLPVAAVVTGMKVRVLPGERVPVDGAVEDGTADLDVSLVTGESNPVAARQGTSVYAGTLNLNGVLTIDVRAAGEETLLAEIVRLIEAAEQGRARYVRIADRIARFYSPTVHVLALVTFLGWWLLVGTTAWPALTAAIAVLIITCPCALGLAVPAVQVTAVDRLLRAGILVKSGDALERLAVVDTVVLDKTGTLTEGRPEIVGLVLTKDADWTIAAALATRSRHPMARALADAVGIFGNPTVSNVTEVPGNGISGEVDGIPVRIGKRKFCEIEEPATEIAADYTSEIWIKVDSHMPRRLEFRDRLRPDAASTIAALRGMGLRVHLLSGDRAAAVAPLASECGIDSWRADCLPADKVAFLESARKDGHAVLMVGDGINDAPAIAAASVGMSPASGASVSQVASDFVFLGNSLSSVVTACRVARRANRLVNQNFALAAGYNALAVPIAMAGFVTPLIAAIAMSSSSIIVTLNALRARSVPRV